MSQKLQQVILTVDDTPAVRHMFRAYLEDQGYKVLEAETGEKALDILAQEQVQLVLLDLQMPGMNGLDVLKEVRKKLVDLPVIVVSGSGDICEVVEAIHRGATDFLQKPVDDLSILLHAVQKALEEVRLRFENRRYQQRLESEVAHKTRELVLTNARMRSVLESTKKLLGCGEINESGPMILEAFGLHMNAGGGSLYEVSNSRLRCVHTLDEGHAADSLVQPLQPGTILARALQEDEPFIIEDIRLEGWPGSGWPGYSSPACLVLPLRDRSGEIFAIISLHNPVSGRFSPHDLEIAMILASYASEALQAAKALAEVKRHEEMMLQSQKLEAVGTLAGGIAHDFNNILSAIVGYTDLSLFSEELPEKVKQNLQQVKKASQRARDLVKQILSFSRAEEERFEPVDITPIIKETLKLLRATIPSSIFIESSIKDSLGRIKTDPGKMHQVLMNLCTNAAQAMAEEGTLRVEYCEAELEHIHNEDLEPLLGKRCVRLSISDTGKGIPPNELTRIFNPYFTTKEKGEGTGLGLALVNGIVRSAGGRVTVESTLGEGTSFHVYLPCVDCSRQRDQQQQELQMQHGNEHILFVDDEETLAEMAKEMLERLGYRVTIMTSSVKAESIIDRAANEYDLLITDQTMPAISGLELARKAVHRHPELPIILYTGYSAAISEREAEQIGIRKILMKPLSMTLLSQAVREVLDDRSP